MPGATGPTAAMTVESATVAGRYELVGVNGGLLPVALDPEESASEATGRGVLAGELRLESNGTYLIELIVCYDLPSDPGGIRTVCSGGTWRFLPSALDRTSGEVRLISGCHQTSAAVAGVALVHRMRRPELHPGAPAHWVYIRR